MSIEEGCVGIPLDLDVFAAEQSLQPQQET